MPDVPVYAGVRFDSPTAGAESVVRRYDHGELRGPQKTRDGFLRVEGIITRSGIFDYVRTDGTKVREYRPPEEVFHPESLASFALTPLTNEHPADLLTPETVRDHQVGSVGTPVRTGDSVRADMVITDRKAIKDVENGKTGLSCGYTTRVLKTPGVLVDANGSEQRFDVVQTLIRGNHIAMCGKGRAGEGARIRMDALDATQSDEDPQIQFPIVPPPAPRMDALPPKGPAMKEVTINGVKVMVEDAVAAHLEGLQAKSDALEASAKKEQHPAAQEAYRAENEQLKGQLAATTAELKKRQDSEATLSKKKGEAEFMRSRVLLLSKAGPIIEKTFDEMVTMDDAEIIRSVVTKEAPEIDITGKSDDYVRGIYETVTAKRTDTAAELNTLIGAGKKAAESKRLDADVDKKIAEARKKMTEDMQNAWKPASTTTSGA